MTEGRVLADISMSLDGFITGPNDARPVFVATHQAREELSKDGGTTFTFVTDGIEPALERAKAAARDRDVSVARASSSSACAPGSWTRCSSTSRRCCSAAGAARSRTSEPSRSSWTSRGWSTPPAPHTSDSASRGESRRSERGFGGRRFVGAYAG